MTNYLLLVDMSDHLQVLAAIRCTASIETVRMLLDNLDDINYENGGDNPKEVNILINLAKMVHDNVQYMVSVLKEVLKRGANINTVSKTNGDSAIMCFAKNNMHMCVKILLKSGADLGIKNDVGQDIFHYEYSRSFEVRYLLEGCNKRSIFSLIRNTEITEELIMSEFERFNYTQSEINNMLYDLMSSSTLLKRGKLYDLFISKGADIESVLSRLKISCIMSLDKIDFLVSKGLNLSYDDFKLYWAEYKKLCDIYSSDNKRILSDLANREKDIIDRDLQITKLNTELSQALSLNKQLQETVDERNSIINEKSRDLINFKYELKLTNDDLHALQLEMSKKKRIIDTKNRIIDYNRGVFEKEIDRLNKLIEEKDEVTKISESIINNILA